MKQLFKLLALFVAKEQALWAEFGAQDAVTARAAVDLSSHQYLVMRLSSAPAGLGAGGAPGCNIASHNLGTSAAGLAAGVLQNNPQSGQAATIAYQGWSKVKVGAQTTANALATHDSSGFAINAVSGSTVIGRFAEASTGALQVVGIRLFPPVKWGSVA
jgi:hypothetical protein